MDVVITGGAGFLGSHLCEHYVERGDRVLCYDNLVTGRADHLAELRGASNFSFVEQDVTEYLDLDDTFLGQGTTDVDRVLHFASPASPEDYQAHPIKTLKVGSLGTHRALGVAKKYDARFMLASTSEVYGDPEVHPQPESYWGNVNPLGLRGVYDESKRFAEAMTMAYHRRHDLDIRIVRIFNTYGPRMRLQDGRVVPNFLSQALQDDPLTVYGDGSQTRSFCFVTDLIRGILRLMEVPVYEPVNLGNPDEISILEFARLVREVTGSDSEIVYRELPEDDPKRRRPDLSRARDRLDWQPEVPLREGLERTLPYFREALGIGG